MSYVCALGSLVWSPTIGVPHSLICDCMVLVFRQFFFFFFPMSACIFSLEQQLEVVLLFNN